MATIDPMMKFAEQVMKLEGVLQESKITGDPGRVLFVLTRANNALGVTQKEVVESTSLRKDTVSKLVDSLVQDGLLTQERESRMKRLKTSDSGRKLLSRVKASLRSPRPVDQAGKKKTEQFDLITNRWEPV
jgi:DNA-binding MarR family transcriptional regulator